MDKQLRECPFCGTEPHISPRVGWWKAFCDQGNQDHICIVYGKTKREAIKKWNATRPPQNSGDKEFKTELNEVMSTSHNSLARLSDSGALDIHGTKLISEPPMTQTFQDGVNYVLENPSDYGLVPKPRQGAVSVEEIESVLRGSKAGQALYLECDMDVLEGAFPKLAEAIYAKLGAPQADKGEELEK